MSRITNSFDTYQGTKQALPSVQSYSPVSFGGYLKSKGVALPAFSTGSLMNAPVAPQAPKVGMHVNLYMKTEDMLYSGGNGTGMSFCLKYAENSTVENPMIVAKGWDENGKEFTKMIEVNKVDPMNATFVEMRALEAHLKVDQGGCMSSLSTAASSMTLNQRGNFIDTLQQDVLNQTYLGQRDRALFYLQTMNTYLDFINSK